MVVLTNGGSGNNHTCKLSNSKTLSYSGERSDMLPFAAFSAVDSILRTQKHHKKTDFLSTVNTRVQKP